jgi:23S rRNA (adenine2503-C2)-methyltransferase
MSDTRTPAIDIALLGDATGVRAPAVAAPAAAASRTNIFDFDRASLERFFEEELGEKKFRAQQVMKWIHHRYVTDFGDMTDLGKVLRAKLEARAVVHAPQVVLDKASDRRHPQVAAGHGRGTRSRPCTSRTRAAARCACPARWVAA